MLKVTHERFCKYAKALVKKANKCGFVVQHLKYEYYRQTMAITMCGNEVACVMTFINKVEKKGKWQLLNYERSITARSGGRCLQEVIVLLRRNEL